MLKVKTSVSRITINGILFYKEVETNILFNPDTLEEVGVWNSITKTIDELPNDEFSEEEDEDENIFSDEDEDEEIPWCYENNKYAVCNCPQPCNPPSDDEEEEEEENKLCEECGKPFEDGNWRRDEMCDCHQCDCGKLLKVNDNGFIGVCSMCFTDYGNINE